ncbi:MAG: hypothetical protein KDD98_05150, partial [Sphingomonadaceae bacterium]|nr:hypothetical protein [Sphingomonadaceae bacterium]
MKRLLLIGAAATVLGAPLVLAQGSPESLLPPGFDDPAPAPTPAPAPRAAPAPTGPSPSGPAQPSAPVSGPVVQTIPGNAGLEPIGPIALPDNLPSLEELEAMSVDDLDNLLGLKPKYDIPPAARRSMERVGILSRAEGGLPAPSLAKQPASIVRAALKGTKGPILSRWGHIMLRRALASRLETPEGMQPVEFAGLRVGLLNRMGEFATARAVAQDVDATNWNNALTDVAITAYIGTADITGSCPVVRLRGGTREDA